MKPYKYINKNFIHPTSIIEDGVDLGFDNYIGPFCYIAAGVQIGNNNRFEGYCSIGTQAEHKEYLEGGGCTVVIGNNNTFREYVTINAGTTQDTKVADNCILLRGSHLGHDSTVERDVTLSCNVLIGGHSYIMEGANMGLGAICHQYSLIGAYSLIGMGGIVTKKSKILPGGKYIGNPVRNIGINTIGLTRNDINVIELDKHMKIYDNIIERLHGHN